MLGGCTNEVGGVRTPLHPPQKIRQCLKLEIYITHLLEGFIILDALLNFKFI